ncbi:hypothetical protein [Thermococcus piezophilus]|uniref:hypothetical protein n=1 Tax=Thermococcus piezophilus TaxID=1712654 RepID=UPI0019002543|nr:hypothetical protein [Thermococcus piezophilus]
MLIPAFAVFVLDIIGYLLDEKIYYLMRHLLEGVGFGLMLIIVDLIFNKKSVGM